jgi:hypothetical protein
MVDHCRQGFFYVALVEKIAVCPEPGDFALAILFRAYLDNANNCSLFER